MSTYTPSLGLELITPGSQAGLWGNTTNNTFNLIDQAITGVTPLSFASASGTTQTLTDFNGAEDQARAAVLNITGTASGPNTVVVPNKQKTYLVRNGTGQDITFQTAVATTSNIVPAGNNTLIFCDGNNGVFPGILVPGAGTLGVNGGGTGVTSFSAGFVKSLGGTTALTSSPTVSLTTEVAGTLAVANGGTGKSSLTSGALLFGNGTGAVGEFVGNTNGQVATWTGSGWTASAPTTGVTAVTASSPLAATLGSTPNISLNTSGVVPGVYTNTNLTVDSYGRITAAASGSSGGTGTVTSVSGSGGATGLTLTGGPITTSGTLTIGGTLAVGSGGTNKTSWTNGAAFVTSNAFSSGTLPIAYGGTNVTSWSNGAVYASGGALTSGALPVSYGGTGATSTTGSAGSSVLSTSPTIYNLSLTGASGSAVNALTALDRASISYNSGLVGAAAWMYSVSGNPTTDVDSGALIKLTNPSALIGVRDKYIRVTQSGALEVLNTAYSSQLLRLLDTGDFYIAGEGYKPSGGSWAASSDARLKENVQPLTGSLDKILALNPVTYDWKYDTTETTTGFIAQEVQSVIPTAISEIDPSKEQKPFIPDGEKALAIGWKNDMTAYLVGAIKELKAELDAANAKIAVLEAK